MLLAMRLQMHDTYMQINKKPPTNSWFQWSVIRFPADLNFKKFSLCFMKEIPMALLSLTFILQQFQIKMTENVQNVILGL